MNAWTDHIIKISSLPPIAVSIYAWIIFKDMTREIRIFSWFIFLSAIIELVAKILWFYSKNNLPLLHIYVAAGFVCLTLFYEEVLSGFIDKKITMGMLIAFLVFTVLNSIFIQPVFTFNSYALTVESVLIVILSLSTYIFMMDDVVRKRRIGIARSLNWINSGLFIYYSSSLLIFYFGNLITHFFSREINLQTWALHSFFLLIMNCCFFVGLWHRPRT